MNRIATHSFSTTKKFRPIIRSNANGKRIHHREPGAIRFCGIDGEGIDRDGEHRYALFGVGQDQIINEDGLSWQEVFKFLYSHYSKGVAYVGFFLGYDFNQIFKTLPEERARMLLTEEGRQKRLRRGKNPTPWPVRCDGWEFDILAMKRLKIRPQCCDYVPEKGKPACTCKKRPWMAICDSGSFFQQSFLAVIDPAKWKEPVVTDEEYATIEKGKSLRADKTCVDNDMRFYNRLENEVLERVMSRIDAGFREIGIYLPPTKWFGPGQAAQAWLVNEGVTKRERLEKLIPSWALDAAKASYFGGWFEIMIHGIIPGIIHEYDINSAYPFIISQLPCLEHGSWTRGQGHPGSIANGELCLVRARVWTRTNMSHHPRADRMYIGAMLHRDNDNRIYRPSITEGWYWWHELEAANRAKCITRLPKMPPKDTRHPQVFEWIKYTPCDCFPPMRHVKSLYLKRQAVGKDSPLGKGAKTAYNSMYGKFAQSVGNPVFANPIYASLITAGCRTMILDAIATHPKGKEDVSMVATDAVYFLSPHPSLRTGESLGEWEHKERSNLCQFKPGVYWDDSARREVLQGRNPHFKARGISASDFASELARIDRTFAEWDGRPPPIHFLDMPARGWPEVRYYSKFSMVSCLQALRRGNWTLAGYVSNEEERVQSSNPYEKRMTAYYDGHVYRSEPFEPGLLVEETPDGLWTSRQDCQSKPYEKQFGMDDPWSQERLTEFGLSPDGLIGDLIGYAFKGITT